MVIRTTNYAASFLPWIRTFGLGELSMPSHWLRAHPLHQAVQDTQQPRRQMGSIGTMGTKPVILRVYPAGMVVEPSVNTWLAR